MPIAAAEKGSTTAAAAAPAPATAGPAMPGRRPADPGPGSAACTAWASGPRGTCPAAHRIAAWHLPWAGTACFAFGRCPGAWTRATARDAVAGPGWCSCRRHLEPGGSATSGRTGSCSRAVQNQCCLSILSLSVCSLVISVKMHTLSHALTHRGVDALRVRGTSHHHLRRARGYTGLGKAGGGGMGRGGGA